MEVEVKHEDGSRSASPAQAEAKPPRKASPHEPTLFGDLPDATSEACSNFQVITDCLYGSKNMGSTDNDAFDCDCREELGASSCN